MRAALTATLIAALAVPPPLFAEGAAAADAAGGNAPRFGLPIRCTLGEDCYVQNYVDRDPGPGWRDYACGALSYDGHNGTDFRVPSLAHMEAGVEVVAAAAGVVAGLRDGEPDVSVRERGKENLGGRDAGNGVRIRHPGGWETQYSHLKRGSVRVRIGQRVAAGEVLGLVGLSGNTEFPHVDFVVRRDGRAIDPFDPQPPGAVDGDAGERACASAPTPASVWDPALGDALRYRPTGVLISGFAGEPVERAKAQRGGYREAPAARAPVLAFYVESFGLRRGDVEHYEIDGPGGRPVIRRTNAIDRHLAVRFGYVGRRLASGRWPEGNYVARYRVERDGEVVAGVTRETVIR